MVLEVERVQRASRSVSSASFEAPDIERLPNEASFELPPLFLKDFELWGEENQDDEEVDKKDFQNPAKRSWRIQSREGWKYMVQQCMHGTNWAKNDSYRSNFSGW